jgi:LemA protein
VNPLVVVAIAAAVAGLWFIAVYNRFIGVRQHLRESWADIDVQLKRRHDLIPNLVETVKGYAGYERETLERVVELRNRAAAEHGTAAAMATDESALMRGVKDLFVVVEKYPDLKANRHFLSLQKELANTEDVIAAARRFYNGNVRELNTMRESFPTNLVANLLKVEPATYFELDNAAERVVPRLGLGDA